MDVDSWLERFDNFAGSQKIRSNRQKCNALLSRLDENVLMKVKGLLADRPVNSFNSDEYQFSELRSALANVFKKPNTNLGEAWRQFATRD